MHVLVSVRSVDEALAAARGGADFIDLKDPARGALGGLPLATIGAIVAVMRERGITALPLSATIGDFAAHELAPILQRVHAVAETGVDIVKVGVVAAAGARELLSELSRSGRAIVPVFVADEGLDDALIEQALGLPFAGVMVDTADKRAGSLFDRVEAAPLRRFIGRAQEAGVMVGLAGALRITDAARLAALAPDFAGFRSAVCAGDRAGALDAGRLRALVQALRSTEAAQCSGGRSSPSSIDLARASSVR